MTWRRVISLEQAARQISIKEEEIERHDDEYLKMSEQDEQMLLVTDVVGTEEA